MNAHLVALVAALALAAGSANAHTTVVHRNVHRTLAATSKVDLIVTMKTDVNVVESFQEAAYESRGAAITALKNELETAHAKALAPLANLFLQESTSDTKVTTYWISPVASIENASIDIVEKIAALPNVLEIREAHKFTIPESIRETNVEASVKETERNEWGVVKIGAPQVWADGNTGQGIRVGSIDSGVRATHVALFKNFGGNYSWYDPQLKQPKPYDDDGHGTHTMGTIAGVKGVGVAPGVTWMTCRGCRGRDCYEVALLACAQFMLCPTDIYGQNPDCSKAPRVVNNSWGGGQAANNFNKILAAWVKAGIVPVFANGNSGPRCGTDEWPGNHPLAIGVGSTTSADALSYFSSKGSSTTGRVKPDISAPGSDVRSSIPTSDTAYDVYSGTSMAAPHVTGAVALLLHAEPTLTVAQVRARLARTAVQSGLVPTNMTCGGTTDTTWPNNQFGYGRLNVFNAYKNILTPTPASTTPAPTPEPVSTTPAPTPVPTTPAPTGCATPPGGACGSDASGPGCCPDGEYCQQWNPSFYQCRPVAAQCTLPLVGVDFYGDDLTTINDILPWECCDRCAATVGCQAYTFVNYNTDGHAACYLKRGSGDPRASIGAVSALVKSVKPKCSVTRDVDFSGNDLRRVDATSVDVCCDACGATANCKGFTFVDTAWDKQSCYLKTKVNGETKVYSGAVSGVLN